MTIGEKKTAAKRVAADSNDDCFLCCACSGDPATPVLDRPVRWSPGVGAIVAGAGPLTTGYVLIVPDVHYGDIATAIRLHKGFMEFVHESLAEYREIFGEFTVWEHGSAMLDERTSGCVAHAHLNVIPKMTFSPPPHARWVDSWTEFAAQARSPYLMLGHSGESLQVGDDSGVSQHYRRQWAQHIGSPDLWDYAVVGSMDLQWETAESYRQLAPSQTSVSIPQEAGQ